MDKKRWQASFTVEAAVVIPMLLLVICAVLWLGFELHSEVKASAQRQGALEELHTMKEIREQDLIIRLTGE